MAPSSSLTVVVVAVMAMAASVLTAQAQTQACASKLIPCAAYLNATTKPPNSCCDPIKEAVANDLACLCNLYANPAFLSGLGINVTQALNLPRLCDIPADTAACKNAAAPSGSTIKPPSGGSGSGSGSGSTNGVGRIGSSGLVGLFLVVASRMLY